MVNKTTKSNSISISYETLSEEGKIVNKKQTFNLVSYSATDQDFYDIGVIIGNILQYAPKEILKNNVELLVEE